MSQRNQRFSVAFQRDINFVNPQNTLVLAGDKWQDEDIENINYNQQTSQTGVLPAGEALTAVEMESNVDGVMLAVRAVATTTHGADIDNDGVDESVINYRYEMKPSSSTDTYNALPGLSSTLPFGAMGNPVELIPGAYVGPFKAFRIVFENRSDNFVNPVDVDLDKIGSHVHARVLRNVGSEPPVTATEDFASIFGGASTEAQDSGGAF